MTRGYAPFPVLAAMRRKADSGEWTAVPHPSGLAAVRWTGPVLPVPDHARTGYIAYPGDTYRQVAFVHSTGRKHLLTVAHAPWADVQTRDGVPAWLALAVLDDPSLAFDSDRQNALRAARRRPANGSGGQPPPDQEAANRA